MSFNLKILNTVEWNTKGRMRRYEDRQGRKE